MYLGSGCTCLFTVNEYMLMHLFVITNSQATSTSTMQNPNDASLLFGQVMFFYIDDLLSVLLITFF
jgi:hypothetical protein